MPTVTEKCKIYCKKIKKGKSIKLRKENIREYFLEMGKNLFDMAKTAQIRRKSKDLT